MIKKILLIKNENLVKIKLPLEIAEIIQEIIQYHTVKNNTDWDSVRHTIDFQRIHYPGLAND